MGRPTREQRKKIAERLRKLKELDITTEDPDKIQQEVKQISELFTLYGVPGNSSHYRELSHFCEEVASHYKQQSINFKQGKRDYVGMLRDVRLRVTAVRDHLFVSRIYGRRVKLSWRFNKAGRIDSVDAMLFPENTVTHLIKTLGGFDKDPEWYECEARYKYLTQLDVLNPGFSSLDDEKKFQSILRFGHSTTRDLIENLERGNIKDSYDLRGRQRQLSEIVQDEAAMYMVRRAGELMPSISSLDERHLTIFYE